MTPTQTKTVRERVGAAALKGFTAIQPVFLILLIFFLFPRLRIYLDDALLGDGWFRFQHSDPFVWEAFASLPFFVTGALVWLYMRSAKRFIPQHPAQLLILPALLVVAWHQSYAWAKSYPLGGMTTKVRQDGKVGCVSKAGVTLLKASYEDVFCTGFDLPLTMGHMVGNGGEDYIPVKLNGKWGFLDRSKATAISPQFDDIGFEAHWGLRAVKKNGKWGYIHARTGTVAIPFTFDNAGEFSYGEGMPSPWAAVSKGGKWGFIDRLGKTRIPFQFDLADSHWFTNGYELADRARRTETQSLWKTFWMTVSEPASASPAYARVRVGDLWGIIDSTNRTILRPSIPGAFVNGLNCDTRSQQCYVNQEFWSTTAKRTLLTADTLWNCQGANPDVRSCEPDLIHQDR